jgi:hypothetical protein
MTRTPAPPYEKLGRPPDETVDWGAAAEYFKDLFSTPAAIQTTGLGAAAGMGGGWVICLDPFTARTSLTLARPLTKT